MRVLYLAKKDVDVHDRRVYASFDQNGFDVLVLPGEKPVILPIFGSAHDSIGNQTSCSPLLVWRREVRFVVGEPRAGVCCVSESTHRLMRLCLLELERYAFGPETTPVDEETVFCIQPLCARFVFN
jgi:hypothetical protein